MHTISLIVGLSHIGTALLIMLLSLPLLLGNIGPNRWYGVRFPASYSSTDAWYSINRYGATRLIVWSIPVLAGGIMTLLFDLGRHESFLVPLSFVPLVYLIAAADAWLYGRRYVRTHG